MNKTLLINRLDPKDDSDVKRRMFFLMGGMNFSYTENKLNKLLDKVGTSERNNIIYKYNGVELYITTQDIPAIIKLLCNEGFSIYSVYEIYNPVL